MKYVVYIQNFLLSKAEFIDVEVNEIQIKWVFLKQKRDPLKKVPQINKIY